ncbi:MAG TPA: phospholipase D-like domain-containing protein [Gemmatimonadaceae bacterium]|nr:phospholipase D-like domain-containing protein [Gemmatimonadaceae bacterium]
MASAGRPRTPSDRDLLDQALSRAADAPPVTGNGIRLLRNSAENYPAWLDAIRSARRTVYFESYIIRADEAGAMFADALAAKAREGVRVRVIYDWLGDAGRTPRRYWRSLGRAGVAVRCFNPPQLASPFGWLHRDHRKSLTVDGGITFVSGLCVGQPWIGDPQRGIEPWRDTGVEVRGPAARSVEEAFARAWAAAGPPIPHDERASSGGGESAGRVALRVVATEPFTAGVLRLDQIMAAAARRTLWLTDAYFVGTPPYVHALCSAARDGVDVRLLVPGGSDIPILRPLSQAGYRPLLEAGVRVFEWMGSMLHAKSAVVDERWARVGSSNLNLASWLGNWELDVAVDDAAFARAMERMYVDDLANATEIVLGTTRRRARGGARRRPVSDAGGGSAGRIAAGALRLGNAAGAMITERRALGPAEAQLAATMGAVLLAIALVAVLWPRVIALPLTLLVTWIGGAMLAKAYALRRRRRAVGAPAARVIVSPATATSAGSRTS